MCPSPIRVCLWHLSSNPNINIALTEYYNLKTKVGFAADAPPSVSAQAKGGCEATVTNAAARINGGLRKLSGRSQIVYNDNL